MNKERGTAVGLRSTSHDVVIHKNVNIAQPVLQPSIASMDVSFRNVWFHNLSYMEERVELCVQTVDLKGTGNGPKDQG